MLSITDLSGGYHRGAAIVEGVTLDLSTHRITSIVGSNGAGKSTLLRAVCGLLPWYTGSILLDGERIDGLKPHAIARRGLRMVAEGRGTFSGQTVLENLRIGGYGLGRQECEKRLE